MYRLMSIHTIGNEAKRLQNPRADANIFEIISFSWMLNLFKDGKKRDLNENDLYAITKSYKSSVLGDKLEKKWQIELNNAKTMSRDPSLVRVLIKIFGVKFMLLGLLQAFVEIVLKLSQPLLIGRLLEFFNFDDSKKIDAGQACIYAFCLLLSMFTAMILYTFTQLEMLYTGMAIRVSCSSIIFKKALRLSKMVLGETTGGQVVNLLSNDVLRFDSSLISPHYLWISPLQTIVATYFIWQNIGVSSLVGLAACFSFIPLQGWLGKKTSEFRLKTAAVTDERLCLMNELITGIQVIKMFTWEKPFAYIIQQVRKKEMQLINRSSYVKATLASFVTFHTRMSLFFCILSYFFLGNYISSQKVFVITTYYHMLQATLTTRFTHGISQTAEMLVSVKRIQSYLLCGEKDNHVEDISKTLGADTDEQLTTCNVNNPGEKNINNKSFDVEQSKNIGINIHNVTAKWTDAQPHNCLQNVNLTIKPKQLMAIIGPVGAGKSSLVQAILQEIYPSEGQIAVNGTVSYASQEPWLFSGSVKQNIVFDSPIDYKRYDQVIKLCALDIDFKQLPYGDKTVVGERGVTLSGGQRARINLARAIYKQADIYLLDDPLSAVDPHVGKQLFEQCIKDYLKDKACLLVTHQLQYLSSVDNIILMDKAKIVAEGTYEELQANNLDFTKFLQSSIDKKCFPTDTPDYKHENANKINENSIANRRVSVKSVLSVSSDVSKVNGVTEEGPTEIIETRCSGNVSRAVYSSYISAGGGICKTMFFIIICISTQLLASGGDLWITHWVNLEEHVFRYEKTSAMSSGYNGTSTVDVKCANITWWPISRWTCLVVYAFFTFATIMAIALRSLTFVSLCTKASKQLHTSMFEAVTRATMFFFNTNSSGFILNRFSKDMGAVDERILTAFMDFVHYGSTLVGVFIVVGIVKVYLLIPTFILGFLFYKLMAFYLSTSRSIKRLEGITRSPLITHLNASLQGLTTIRAFKVEPILCQEFDNHQDLHSSAWYLFVTSNRAFALWCELVCLVYIGVVTFSFIVIGDSVHFGGNVGLVITQAFGLAGLLQFGMRQSAGLENSMTSVERIKEYAEAPQEPALESPMDEKLPAKWPLNGQITFKNYYLRYNEDAPFVLRNVNIEIAPKQKIGIVGRTGAGKSSLIGALFRLGLSRGSVTIDGVEIHDLGLRVLRSQISIIPQEPILFSGTVRKNLDPFDEFSDSTLWDALDEVRLKNVIGDSADGLNSKTSEGGSNFSVGQKQLLCLARAIVRNNKILVLDEATANVDQQTDAMIQNTIRTKFRSCTVLVVAHRLNTVMDSDKVLVLDAGKVVEFDHPHNLLRNKNGYLYKMVEQTGSASVALLHSIAEQSYKNRNLVTEPSKAL